MSTMSCQLLGGDAMPMDGIGDGPRDDYPKIPPTPVAITRYFNVFTAKVVALVLVLIFIFFHGIFHLKYGNNSCGWLLTDGRLQGHKNWQPYGCMIHKYSKSESCNCMHYISYWDGKNHIVFLGDSRIRQLYFSFVNTLSKDVIASEKAHSDLHYTDRKLKLKVDFLWHPIINGSVCSVYTSWLQRHSTNRPNLVITGGATWNIKLSNASEEALQHYEGNLTHIEPLMNLLNDTTKVIWMLQDPVVERKLFGNRSMITNRQINKYNRAASHILAHSSAEMWRSSQRIAEGHSSSSPDGLHAGKVALDLDVQMLLNMYCNAQMNFDDGTCCNTREAVTTVQIITAVVFILSMILSAVFVMWRWFSRKLKTSVSRTPLIDHPPQLRYCHGPVTPSDKTDNGCFQIVIALGKLGVIMGYFFLCDRTDFFMKENKYYTHTNFFLPFLYLMILGIFFMENTKQTCVLHRDQTDEWKGWMQLVILIYHLTGASQMLTIYMQIRVLVSAYLLLSGYGHFCYFWTTGDYSLYRFCQVMFRMNFLVIVLCFVMNRPYQFYYFVPLVSFWFLLIYVTMAIWPHITSDSTDVNRLYPLMLIVKVLLLVIVTTLLYTSEVFFEKVFLSFPLKALFVTSDDSIYQWRFQWQIDRYGVIYGVVFASGLLIAKRYKVFDDSERHQLFSNGVTTLLGVLAACGLLCYFTLTSLCRNKDECNNIHPYISFLPIVSYIILRNLLTWLRTRYSTFFAWFGRISLELCVTQYHVWLAADTHGVLVLVPNYPVMNAIVTSFIFVCTAHEIHHITVTLTRYAVPHDWKCLLRNIMCFIAILLPIAITNGVLGF